MDNGPQEAAPAEEEQAVPDMQSYIDTPTETESFRFPDDAAAYGADDSIVHSEDNFTAS